MNVFEREICKLSAEALNDIDESGSGLTDANNDGRTDGNVGDNGLDVALEAQDDFIDPDFLNSVDSEMFDVTGGLPINPLSLPIDPHTGIIGGHRMIHQAFLLKDIFIQTLISSTQLLLKHMI